MALPVESWLSASMGHQINLGKRYLAVVPHSGIHLEITTSAGRQNTNVIELYSHVIKSNSQLTYYDSGIGTYARPSWRPSFSHLKRFLDNKIDLAIAW